MYYYHLSLDTLTSKVCSQKYKHPFRCGNLALPLLRGMIEAKQTQGVRED